MNRRQALKTLGSAALAQLAPQELLAVGRALHARLQRTTEPVAIDAERYIFKSLDPEENEMVVVASERILPETDTPGAKAARVNEFIDLMLTEWFTEEEIARFHEGLADLDRRAREAHGARFVECTEQQQVALLEALEREALERERELESERERSGTPVASSASPADRPFFPVLKWLTLYGYFTSEIGMQEELEHVIFPGSYDGCVPIRRARAE